MALIDDSPTSEPRHSMVIITELRTVIDRKLRTDGAIHGFKQLDELMTELEKALILEALETSLLLREIDGPRKQ